MHGESMSKWRWIFSLSAALTCCAGVQAKELDEGLELRRIADYWKEQDFASVKRHIGVFLQKNGESPYCDQLYLMLGDIYFREKGATNELAPAMSG